MTTSPRPEQDHRLARPASRFLGTPTRVNRPRLAIGWLAGGCAAVFLSVAPAPALAQGKLEAQYEASLAGIAVGRGTWGIEISDDYYSASAQGATAGLLKAFAGGTGSGSVQGRIVNGALVPSAYTA